MLKFGSTWIESIDADVSIRCLDNQTVPGVDEGSCWEQLVGSVDPMIIRRFSTSGLEGTSPFVGNPHDGNMQKKQ